MNELTFEEISLEGGKYTVRFYSNGELNALRHGKAWRDLAGDKLALAMMQEIQRLQENNKKLSEFACQFSKFVETNPKLIAPWKIRMEALIESVKPILPLSEE